MAFHYDDIPMVGELLASELIMQSGGTLDGEGLDGIIVLVKCLRRMPMRISNAD